MKTYTTTEQLVLVAKRLADEELKLGQYARKEIPKEECGRALENDTTKWVRVNDELKWLHRIYSALCMWRTKKDKDIHSLELVVRKRINELSEGDKNVSNK